MKTKHYLVLATLIFLASCSKTQFLSSELSPSENTTSLLAYTIEKDYIHFDVVSHGCTMMTSFELRLVSEKDNSFAVVRVRPDFCRIKPIKMSLNYSFKHLGLDLNRPIYLTNPVNTNQLAIN